MAKVDGQEKVIAAAQHIVNSLATSKNAAEDMIRILSGFDNRLSHLFPAAAAAAAGGDGQTVVGMGKGDDGDKDDECEPQLPSEKEIALEAAEVVLYTWQSSDALLFEASQEEVEVYMGAVDSVINLADPDGSPDGDRGLYDRAETALQTAMARLEDEFLHLMIRNTVPLDPQDIYASASRTSISFASGISEPDHALATHLTESLKIAASQPGLEDAEEGNQIIADLVHPDAVIDLQAIASRMILAGYGKELCQVYSSVRRDVLDECLSIMGIERISIDEVQRMEWQTLDDKMSKWSQSMKGVVRVLLAGEHRLCNEVFINPSSGPLRNECFAEATKGCLMQVLNFADAVSISRRSSEKLFRILGMYEALSDMMPDLRFMFLGDAGVVIVSEAEGIMSRLGDAAKGTLNEFGNQVQKETSRKAIMGGEIHPLTRYVMNYMQLLVDYRDSLDVLLDNSAEETCISLEGDDSVSPLCRCLLNLISSLESNLEEKAKLYEDSGMHHIFLMNNILYVVQKVRDSELKNLLGDHWVRRRRGQVRQYATRYLRASWTKALSYLKDDGLTSSGSGGSGGGSNTSKIALQERFKGFNLAFEEIYRNQSTWKVPDPQLREELRISISEKVIPAYRAFMGRFRNLLEGGKHTSKYIKYSPEDLENFLLDLFEGLPSGQPNCPRRKLSS